MAVGQGAFSVSDVARLSALEDRLERSEAARGAAHAAQLQDVLQLHAVHTAAGLGLSTASQVALLLRCSESRAGRLLSDALGLAGLPGAFDVLSSGLLSVEQASVVVAQLAPLSPPDRLQVWQRLLARLEADREQGAVLPAPRLADLLRRWAVEVDAQAAAQRRREAQQRARVGYRKGDDGLVDLFLEGISGPLAQACLLRIRALSAPVGVDDERSADRRRLDAAVDLLLGRVNLPLDGCDPESSPGSAGCGCRLGAPVPCGARVVVHVPFGAATGTTDEAAEVVGHGPVEADLLQQILLSAPELRAVFVDPDGVPVAVGDDVRRVARDDPKRLRQALLALAASRPGETFPRSPDDHPTPARGRPPEGLAPQDGVPGNGGSVEAPSDGVAPSAVQERAAHPAATPGPYRVRPRLRRAVTVRAPRCEWPGCGVRAECCDIDHDEAHPDGPTCSCNLGPLCRRHHQVKQQGWTKRRGSAGVTFTSPTGRSWLSRPQHAAPATPVRQVPAGAHEPLSPLDVLSALELERELWSADPGDPRWDDPDGLGLRAVDLDPESGEPHDSVRDRLTDGDTRWSLDLADPGAWLDQGTCSDAATA
jgi:hypothetical protein